MLAHAIYVISISCLDAFKDPVNMPQSDFARKMSHSNCLHPILTLSPSSYAQKVGYHRPSAQQRAAAAGSKKTPDSDEAAFPSPLVLPGDDLAVDPKWPPQSLRSWVHLSERNQVATRRKTIYVADYPNIDLDMHFMKAWNRP